MRAAGASFLINSLLKSNKMGMEIVIKIEKK